MGMLLRRSESLPAARLKADSRLALQSRLGGVHLARSNVSALANQLSINGLHAFIIPSWRIALQIIAAVLVRAAALFRGIGQQRIGNRNLRFHVDSNPRRQSRCRAGRAFPGCIDGSQGPKHCRVDFDCRVFATSGQMAFLHLAGIGQLFTLCIATGPFAERLVLAT